MLHKNIALLPISLFVAAAVGVFVGCGSSEPVHQDQADATLKAVTLHFDGFKKSKSGAT